MPTSAVIFWTGFLVTALTGFFNLSIISIDDYNNGFAIMVPAQESPHWRALISGIHPYVPKLLLLGLGQIPLLFGILDPISQMRFALALLGGVVFVLQFWATTAFFDRSTALQRRIAQVLICFYWALPLFSTRPMIETFCMPFLTWSAVHARNYQRSTSPRSLLMALGFLGLASMMRFQAGICVLGLACVVLQTRRPRELSLFLAFGLGVFVLTGLPDWFLQGRFHSQLRSYVEYNIQYSGEHFGRMPFYTFLALTFGLTLPPALLSRYRGFAWKEAFAGYLAPLSYFVFFLLAHTLSPHKEERFLVPVVPIFLFCLVPLAAWLREAGAPWRKAWFVGLNAFLLLVTCTNTAQRNLIQLTAWLALHPEISAVDGVGGALVFYPQALLLRKVQWASIARANYSNSNCSTLSLLRSDFVPDTDWNARYEKVTSFEPGWVEKVLIRTNSKNARRGPLVAYLPKRCSALTTD